MTSPSGFVEIPLGLRNLIESGGAVLFIGAGAGWSAYDKDGKPMPDGSVLAAELASHFRIETSAVPVLPKIAGVVELRNSRSKLIEFITARLSNFAPNDHLQMLMRYRWRAIYTTNYDDIVEKCYALNPNPMQNPVSISSFSQLKTFDSRLDVPVYHLHGFLYGETDGDILVTQHDYTQFAEKRTMLFDLLKKDAATNGLLYLGYSNSDPNWEVVNDEMRRDFAPSTPPPAYRVSKSTDDLDKELLKAQGIHSIDATIDEFAVALAAAVDVPTVATEILLKAKGSVPSDLHAEFDTNPSPVLRLLRNWEYVNQADFAKRPNVNEFLQGFPANWSLIEEGLAFDRDVEDEVYEGILDDLTAPKLRPTQRIILGPAGYGISTILAKLAVRLVKDNAARVFALRPGAVVNAGDLEYACTYSKLPIVFIVDNASDYVKQLYPAVQHIRTRSLPHLILAGDRLNEWRVRTALSSAIEYLVEPLSEVEIGRLLDFLGANDALNKLAGLERSLQFAAIQKKHDRQLLVAMKEATEGASFNAIIQSEYHGLPDDVSRRAYAAVSCAYSDRLLLRDSLLADVLGRDLIGMYRDIRDSLEGVIDHVLIDEANEVYAARCRHHEIAKIVWEGCVSAPERAEISSRLMQMLNLHYPQDASLFEALVQDDSRVDGLPSFEAKTDFFEWACKKDPKSPYVKQHYARMLQRVGRYELALSQVDKAIELSAHNRVLHHTKGVILRDMAIASPRTEASRRRLVQAEEAFRAALSRDEKDTYSYQSLAELYLGWAKGCADDGEQVTYIGKCEEVIAEGVIKARKREDLWIVSAKVQDWIGSTPAAIDCLKKATHSRVAKIMLARQYLRMGKPTDAEPLLKGCLADDPHQHRAAIDYARCLLALGEEYLVAANALRMAELYGVRDPEYIAILGGLLFLAKESEEAKRVFQKSYDAAITFADRRRIAFRPTSGLDDPTQITMRGIIRAVSAGKFSIEVVGYPRIEGRSYRISGRNPATGMAVRFRLAFNAEGPVAEHVDLEEQAAS